MLDDEDEDPFGTDEDKYREVHGTIPVDEKVCRSCRHYKSAEPLVCWECDRGSNFSSATKNLKQIHNRLMGINTGLGESAAAGNQDPQRVAQTIQYANGIRWVLSPFGSEDDLYERLGFEWDQDFDEDKEEE